MSALSTSLSFCTGGSNQCNKARKINKAFRLKKKNKTLFKDDKNLYVENHKESTKKLVE